MNVVRSIAAQFGLSGDVRLSALTDGHINDTFLAECDDGQYVLQRLNTDVFRLPEAVMHNIEVLCSAFDRGTEQKTSLPNFLTANGRNYLIMDGFWRAYSYVPGGTADLRQAGRAFGELIRIADGAELADNGLRLHDISGYSERLIQLGGVSDAEMSMFGELVRQLNDVFNGTLPLRNIHGDAKLANAVAGEQCTLLDLDTLSSGWAALDFGDTVRSACPAGNDIDAVYEIAAGYAEGLQGLLTSVEVDSLSWGILFVTAELVMRYCIDGISGEGYFKGKTPDECLARARLLTAQLRGFIGRMDDIRAAVARAFINV